MEEAQAPNGVSPYKIDWPFNLWLVAILFFAYGCLVVSRKLLLLTVLLASAVILLFDRTSSWDETLTLLAELPLGLGSVLFFLCAPPSFRARHFRAFTICVNRMTNRVDVLRTFVESIAACARKFDHGYAHAVADFTKSLLRHWNQFLHSGEIVGAAGSFATWAPARLIPSVASCLAAGADCAVAASGMDKLLDARNSISMRINAPNEMPVVYYRGSTLHDIITCLHTQTLQPSTAEVFYTVRRRCRDRYGAVPAPL
ncbi:hypothetical protein ARSEF4850_001444 [Beauveria asiatica]